MAKYITLINLLQITCILNSMSKLIQIGVKLLISRWYYLVIISADGTFRVTVIAIFKFRFSLYICIFNYY